jgi:hypothetical protein
VKKNVCEMEMLLEQAEAEVAVKSPVAKFFTSFKPPFIVSITMILVVIYFLLTVY